MVMKLKSATRRKPFRAFVAALVLPGALVTSLGAAQAQSTYRLGPQDKVRLKVYEWRAAKDEIFEVEAFTDEFIVGPAGMLSLPLVGEVPAEGLTTEALALSLAEKLKRRLNLVERPDASAEVVLFRPIYVSGQVDKPGEYPFRPNLTVLQTISIAGGLQRTADPGVMRIAREAITSNGELQVLMAEVNGLRVRKARLEAEIANNQDMRLPADLVARKNEPSIALIIEQERLIMKARQDGVRTQLAALEQLKSFLAKEVESLAAQLATEDTQLRLVQKELANISSLVDRGLAVSPRQLSLERTMAQIQGERLRAETSVLRARQEISKADITISDLQNKRTSELAVELRTNEAKLEEVTRKAGTVQSLMRETEMVAPQLLAERMRAQAVEPTYTIVRRIDGQLKEIPATETTPVEPGDTVKVKMLRPEMTPAQVNLSSFPQSFPEVSPQGATRIGANESPANVARN